jgi:hypothetical protein
MIEKAKKLQTVPDAQIGKGNIFNDIQGNPQKVE